MTDANVAAIRYFPGDMMRIPVINVMVLKKSSFDRLIKEAQEKARTEERIVTNRIISRLLDRATQTRNPR